jgi:hypothetical protein
LDKETGSLGPYQRMVCVMLKVACVLSESGVLMLVGLYQRFFDLAGLI